MRFNIQAVSLVLNLDIMQQLDADLAEWWLICQIGERLPCWLDDTRHTEEDGVMVKVSAMIASSFSVCVVVFSSYFLPS